MYLNGKKYNKSLKVFKPNSLSSNSALFGPTPFKYINSLSGNWFITLTDSVNIAKVYSSSQKDLHTYLFLPIFIRKYFLMGVKLVTHLRENLPAIVKVPV